MLKIPDQGELSLTAPAKTQDDATVLRTLEKIELAVRRAAYRRQDTDGEVLMCLADEICKICQDLSRK